MATIQNIIDSVQADTKRPDRATQIQNYVKKAIPKDKLDDLNYHIAQRNAMGSCIQSKDILEEELSKLIDEVSEE